MSKFPKAFHSSPTAYIKMWRNLVFVLGSFIIAATIVGQIKGGRFPSYRDLGFSFGLPPLLYAFCAALTYGGCLLFPVRLGPTGMKSMNVFGIPAVVPWDKVRSVRSRLIQGIPCLYVYVEGRVNPVSIPIWLHDPEGFIAAVREYAPQGNPLLVFINHIQGQRPTGAA